MLLNITPYPHSRSVASSPFSLDVKELGLKIRDLEFETRRWNEKSGTHQLCPLLDLQKGSAARLAALTCGDTGSGYDGESIHSETEMSSLRYYLSTPFLPLRLPM